MLTLGKDILKTLNDSGYEAFFVGGFVRDQLLGIESDDIDITTNARPEDIESIFDKTVATGKKYGTVTVLMDNQAFEVTTYRIDTSYSNHRQPDQVLFSKELKEDLRRRDFTINALAEDMDGEIIDLYAGKKDIKNQIIRAIDNPYDRFEEDALRILRAIRFVGKLGFSIEKNTLEAMKEKAHLLADLPNERVLKEIQIILKQEHISLVYRLFDQLSMGDVFPELKQAFNLLKDASKHLTIEALFALTLYPNHVLDKDQWRFSNKQMDMIERMVQLMNILNQQRLTPIVAYNHDQALMLMADDLLSSFFDEPSQKEKIIYLYKHLVIESFQDLEIRGHDLKVLVKEPKHISFMIEKLIEKVLYEQIENTYESLLEEAKKIAEELDEAA